MDGSTAILRIKLVSAKDIGLLGHWTGIVSTPPPPPPPPPSPSSAAELGAIVGLLVDGGMVPGDVDEADVLLVLPSSSLLFFEIPTIVPTITPITTRQSIIANVRSL
jgi:hypothetical protein